MRYCILDVDLSRPLPDAKIGLTESGLGLVVRWRGRLAGFRMMAVTPNTTVPATTLTELAQEWFGDRLLALEVERVIRDRSKEATPPAPSLTIAICTRNRAERLIRLLRSVTAPGTLATFSSWEIVVVDNAPPDETTRNAVARFPTVHYLIEPRAGLDFARNAALRFASCDWIAFLDDDVVIDRNWANGLYKAWCDSPDAGGYTGLVLPFSLETEAQIYFESHGGFGRGFCPIDFRAAKLDNPLHPVGAGSIGAGCNMAFERSLLLSLGGFDEALDMGGPLPGGGDLDMFYRVLRAGRSMVYEPDYAVYHEHRESIAELRRQYWSWGLGFMAFIAKSRRSDPSLREKHNKMIQWWFGNKFLAVMRTAVTARWQDCQFQLAELRGGIIGFFGAYDRSTRRAAKIRQSAR